MNKPFLKQRTKISSRGQVVLPKAIRLHRNWPPGTELMVEDTPQGVMLKPVSPFTPTTMDEVFGIAKYDGPPVTIEEMDEGIAEMFRREYARD